jgi:flagellar basal-body rod modification protein FlgD
MSTSPVYNLQSIVPTPPPNLRGMFREDEKPEEDFIKLMVAQLQNQDPEKPMDGTALISQMMQMNAAIATNRMSWMSAENALVSHTASLLGKTVEVKDSTTGVPATGKVQTIDYNDARPTVVIDGKSYRAEDVVRVVGE